MSDFDGDLDDWESGEETPEELLEATDDELLNDQYNHNLVSTRQVDDQELTSGAAEFINTPFLELIKDVHVLRVLYGPSDPTINDLTEEIESGLRTILEQLRKDPMGLILDVAVHDRKQLQRAQKIVEDMLSHYRGEEEAKDNVRPDS